MSAMYERECRHRANVARTEPSYPPAPPWRDENAGGEGVIHGRGRKLGGPAINCMSSEKISGNTLKISYVFCPKHMRENATAAGECDIAWMTLFPGSRC